MIHYNKVKYDELYHLSLQNPAVFWESIAKRHIDWFAPWQSVLSGKLAEGNLRWFEGAELNAAYNCLDRHLDERGTQTALIWEADDPTQSKKISYQELFNEVCRFANLLKKYDVKKGERVCIYLPMIPEAIYAMLACARIGAIHTVVFSGFSASALRDRIIDADCKIVITADEAVRAGKFIPLKSNVDIALENNSSVEHVIVIKHTKREIPWNDDRDICYQTAKKLVNAVCPAERMQANDPLFILYTSGSTGKPKGVLHGTGGYLVYTAFTFQTIFNYQPEQIYWCTADVGWITGHSYIVYGPLMNAATLVIYEGIPTYPTSARIWEIVDKHQVNILYTAPTLIRMLMREGDQYVTNAKRSSLQLLGTVGEPINPAAWEWYFNVVGEKRCPVIDTWWQTETGGILIAPIPGVEKLKPGSATKPFFGIAPELVDDDGKKLAGATKGNLVITKPWPGMMQTIFHDHERFIKTYLNTFPGCYFTGDCAERDTDGYYWILGRVDDVLNVAGHRLGTAEIESAIVSHPQIAEAAVVGISHPIKGEAIYAFVTAKLNYNTDEKLQKEIVQCVREKISPIATPEAIQWCTALPKTRSGKIMRRLLRKIANGDTQELGDTSTLADETIIAMLIDNRVKI